VSADLEIPRWIVFSAVPAGSYLMCFRFLQVAWGFWKTSQLPHHDESRVEGVELPPPPEAATQKSPEAAR
jgi:C4-dicarboxylate transporter DctQ subunit